MKKRVCILTALSPKRWAGTEKVALEIWKSLSQEFEVVHLFWSKSEEIDEENDITYYWLSVPRIPWISYYLLLIKFSKYLRKENFDVVIDNWWFSFINLLFHKKKFKLISIIHSWLYDEYKLSYKFMNYIDKVKDLFYHKLVRGPRAYIVKRADKVVVLSKSWLQGIQDKYHISKDKIKIIYNWYDKSNIALKKHNKGIKVCFVSNSHGGKWIDILESVAEKLGKKNIKFYIIWADYNSKTNNIVWVGRLSRNDLYQFMSDSDVIYLPSYSEWQPLVVLEAMWQWCIPIVSWACHLDMLEWTEFERFISYNNKVEDYLNMFYGLLRLDTTELFNLRIESKNLIELYNRDNQWEKYLKLVKWIL